MENLGFNLAGVTFNGHQQVIASLLSEKTKHLARLVREPDNPHDSNAVAVQVNGRRIGYVPRSVAEDVIFFMPQIIKTTVEVGYSVNQDKYFAYCKLLISTEGNQE